MITHLHVLVYYLHRISSKIGHFVSKSTFKILISDGNYIEAV